MHCKVIGWDGEGAGTWLAGMEPTQARSQNVAVFTHFTEITCAVVLAVYTDASDVFTVVSVPLAVTWQAYVLLTDEKSPTTNFEN